MLSLLTVLLGCSPSCSTTQKAPDVVLIIVDTLRADALGFAGSERETSPNLDALTTEFTWFSRAYSTSTWTLPATASILTGLHPFEHRVVRDGLKPDLFGRLDPTLETLADVYKKKGYRTGAFINNAYLAPDFGLNQGFETYDYQGAGPIGHRTAMTTVEKALAWLNSESDPTFLMIHIMEPHADYEPAEAFRGRFTSGLPSGLKLPLGDLVGQLIERRAVPSDEDKAFIRAAYDEEVLSADAAIGVLVDGMKTAGRFETAMIAITSDHGEEFWDFGGYEHGHTTMTPVTQVPLLLKAPDIVPGENATVVSVAGVFGALSSQTGSIMKFARRGVDDTTQIAMSEDILYGPPQISVISNDLRLQINPVDGQMSIFELDEEGKESQNVSQDPRKRALSKPLKAYVRDLREGLGPIKAFDPIRVQNFSDFENLRALGYVD
jgi:membrane-anchored protein YejM (alkaline phosphatase superfamily)